MKGICYLVGAGPGNLGLVTLRAKKLIEQADVIAYDFLVNKAMLGWARKDTEFIYVGKKKYKKNITQEKISRLLVQRVRQGKRVVRLKGGDPFLFARGAEEALALSAAKCSFEVVPGVTAGIAVPYAGIPLSHRIYNSTITFITGHEAPSKKQSSIDWKAVAKLGGTLVIYMGMENLQWIMHRLMQEGMNGKSLAAVIEWGTTGQQRTVTGCVRDIYQKVKKEKLNAPAIIVIGEVVNFRKKFNWFEKKPLHGKRIVLTRTHAQSSHLRALLEEHGADVLEFPTIKIKHYEPKVKINFSEYDWLIFASPNGVEHFSQWYLKKNDIRALAGLKIAAIGPATAEAIKAKGLRVNLLPKKFTSHGLVDSWQMSKTPQKALYPCSNLVRDEIKKRLKKKNVQVDYLQVYQTSPETDDVTNAKQRLRENGTDWIIFTSSSAVENFYKHKLKIPKCRFASLGPVTSSTMRKLGYPVNLEAKESKIESLVKGIMSIGS